MDEVNSAVPPVKSITVSETTSPARNRRRTPPRERSARTPQRERSGRSPSRSEGSDSSPSREQHKSASCLLTSLPRSCSRGPRNTVEGDINLGKPRATKTESSSPRRTPPRSDASAIGRNSTSTRSTVASGGSQSSLGQIIRDPSPRRDYSAVRRNSTSTKSTIESGGSDSNLGTISRDPSPLRDLSRERAKERIDRSSAAPPRQLTRQHSSSTKMSSITRGSTESDGSAQRSRKSSPSINKDICFRKTSNGTTPSGRSSKTRSTIFSSEASVATEISDRSANSKASVNDDDTGREIVSSGASVYTSKTSKTMSSAKTNNSDDTAASDADRAQRRLDRAIIEEKKRIHDDQRRNANNAQPRERMKLVRDQSGSERSINLNDLNPNSENNFGQNSCESFDSTGNTKSILKPGRFAASANGSKNFERSRGASFDDTLRFPGNAKERNSPEIKKTNAVCFAETTIIRVPTERRNLSPRPRGGQVMVPYGDNFNRVRHHPDDIYRRQNHPFQNERHFYEAEDTARRHRGGPPPPEFEQRRHGSLPAHHVEDHRVHVSLPRSESLPGRPHPGGRPYGQHPPNRRLLSPQEQQILTHRKMQQLQGRGPQLQLQSQPQPHSQLQPQPARGHQLQPQPVRGPHQTQLQPQPARGPQTQTQGQQGRGPQTQQARPQQQQPQSVLSRPKGDVFKIFGRNKAPENEPPALTEMQMRMAVAQAAFATVGES